MAGETQNWRGISNHDFLKSKGRGPVQSLLHLFFGEPAPLPFTLQHLLLTDRFGDTAHKKILHQECYPKKKRDKHICGYVFFEISKIYCIIAHASKKTLILIS